jgi:hypothetical protein
MLFLFLVLSYFEENETRMRLCKSDQKEREKKTAELKSKAYLIVRL